MPEMEIVNAVIEKTMLGTEDHGILTACIHLNYGGGVQGFGGYGLDNYQEEKGRVPSIACGIFIAGVMRVTDHCNWEKLPGKIVRVKRHGGSIIAIGHPLKDIWFNPKEELQGGGR